MLGATRIIYRGAQPLPLYSSTRRVGCITRARNYVQYIQIRCFLIFVRIGYHEKTHGGRTNQTLAGKWLIGPCYKVGGGAASRERQRSHVNPGVAAKAGEAVNRNKYKWVVRGFVVESGGRLGPLARTFIDEVVGDAHHLVDERRGRVRHDREREKGGNVQDLCERSGSTSCTSKRT